MANLSKEKRKAVLNELGYSKDDMKRFWRECVELGVPVVKMMDKSGFTWKDLTEHQLRQLPGVKETWLAKQAEAAPVQKEETPPVVKTFEEKMYDKICKGESLSEYELSELVWSNHVVEEIEGDDLRWTRCMETIVELCGHYYSIDWDKALTENQENYFGNQPEEVKPVEKMVKTTEWVSVDKEIEKQPIFKEIPCNIGDYVFVVNDVCIHKEQVYGFYIGDNDSKSYAYTQFPSVENPDKTCNSSFCLSKWNSSVFPEYEESKAHEALLSRQKMRDFENSDYDEDLLEEDFEK